MQEASKFYENEFFASVLQTKSLITTACQWEIHVLTCEKYVLMTMWSLKSFYFAAGMLPGLYIHDDGSLSEESINLFRKHFPSAVMVSDAVLSSNTEFFDLVSRFECVKYWRQVVDYCLARRLVDFPMYGETPYIVVFDSDVLFFTNPKEIVECAERGIPFALRDNIVAYYPSPQTLEKVLRVRPQPMLNGGLWGVQRDKLQISFFEDSLRKLSAQDPYFEWNNFWLDQSLLAALLAEDDRFTSLSEERYGIAGQLISSLTIAHHFPNNYSRKLFFRGGLRRLHELGFMSTLGLDH